MSYTVEQINNILLMQVLEQGESIWEEFESALGEEELQILVDIFITDELARKTLKNYVVENLCQYDLHLESLVLFNECEYYGVTEALEEANLNPKDVFMFVDDDSVDIEESNKLYWSKVIPEISKGLHTLMFNYSLDNPKPHDVTEVLEELVIRGNHYLEEVNPDWLNNYYNKKIGVETEKVYKRKAGTIEALQFNGNNFDILKTFVGGLAEEYFKDYACTISTPTGVLNVVVDDFVVKYSNGELAVYKPKNFYEKYE